MKRVPAYYEAPAWVHAVDWFAAVRAAPALQQLPGYPHWIASCGILVPDVREALPGMDAAVVVQAADDRRYVIAAVKPPLCAPRWYYVGLPDTLASLGAEASGDPFTELDLEAAR